MIAVGIPKKPSGGMPMPSMPGKQKPPMSMGKSDTPPSNDGDLDDGGGIPPEAVSYRSADQKCSSCTFSDGTNCSKLQMPIEHEASCNLFDSKGDEQQGDDGDSMVTG